MRCRLVSCCGPQREIAWNGQAQARTYAIPLPHVVRTRAGHFVRMRAGRDGEGERVQAAVGAQYQTQITSRPLDRACVGRHGGPCR